MNIHELNNFTGTLGSGAYLAIDDGTDTGKISSQGLLAATEARIDNIIAGPAPSAEEIVDARLGADGVTYPSLGDAIRDQFTDVKSALIKSNNGIQTFYGLGNFQHFGLNADGTFLLTQPYRVSNNDPMTFDRDIKVYVENGFKWGYIPFINGSAGEWSGWKITTSTVTTGTSFVVQIARMTEDTSETANVSEFLNALTFETKVYEELNMLKEDVENITVYPNMLSDILLDTIEPSSFTELSVSFTNENYILNAGGSLSSFNGCNVSDFIELPSTQYNRYLRLTGYKFFSGVVAVFYDKYQYNINNAFVPNTEDSTLVIKDYIVKIPADAKYVRFGDNSSKTTAIDSTKVEYATSFRPKINDLLSEKKWLVIGDSWVDPATLGTTAKTFVDYVSENLGCTPIKKGIGGTGYWKTHTENTAFYQRVPDFTETADIISVFGSFNDLSTEDGISGLNIIGTYTDSSTATLCGCMNATFDAIDLKYPNAVVSVIIPPPWANAHDNSYPQQYVDALLSVCKYRNIPCLNLFNGSGMRPWDNTFLATFYVNGAHANTLGHKRFSGLVQKFIESIYYIEN